MEVPSTRGGAAPTSFKGGGEGANQHSFLTGSFGGDEMMLRARTQDAKADREGEQ